MNKQERLAAAQTTLGAIDEGNAGLICAEVAAQFGLTYDEVSEMYWRQMREAYANMGTKRIVLEGWDCHYCGAPAVDFDFFDAPICGQCGG